MICSETFRVCSFGPDVYTTTNANTHLFHFCIFLTKAAADLSYFYGMQNSLQQLDLFGFPIETPAQSKKKEKAAKTTIAPEVTVAPVEIKEVTAEPVVVEKKEEIVSPAIVIAERPSVKKKYPRKTGKQTR